MRGNQLEQRGLGPRPVLWQGVADPDPRRATHCPVPFVVCLGVVVLGVGLKVLVGCVGTHRGTARSRGAGNWLALVWSGTAGGGTCLRFHVTHDRVDVKSVRGSTSRKGVFGN